MNRYYIAEFTETVVDDGVLRPVLPWDGLSANVHCVYPRAEKGVYLESHVLAAIDADAKTHAVIAEAPGITVVTDDEVSAKMKDVTTQKRAEVEQKALAVKVDVRDVTDDTSLKVILDKIGQQLKPGFDLTRLQPQPLVVESVIRAG